MSKNVVLWDGTVVTVSDEDATALANRQYGREEGTSEANAAGARTSMEDVGAVEKAQAFVEGAADTLTFGAYGWAVQELGDDESRFAMQRAAQAAPGYRAAGEVGAALLPTGLLGRGAQAVGEASALGGAARLGRGVEAATGLRSAGRFTEGAALGIGGTVAHTNVTGDPLSVEGLLEGAGIGGVLNVGAGALADRLTGASDNAKKAIAEAEELATSQDVAKAKSGHFENDAGVATAYNHFKTAVKVREQAARKALSQWEKQEQLYNSFATNNKALTGAIEDAENAIRTVRNRYSPHPAPGQAPSAQHPGFDVSDVPNAPGAKGLDIEWIDGKPRAKMYSQDADGVERVHLHTSKPPISDDLDTRLKDYQTRVSRLYQMKGGRAKLSAAKWAPSSPADVADPEAIMGELRSLYADLQRDFPKAAAKLKPVPAPLPPRPPLPHSVELAPNFKAFTRQRSDTVRRLVEGMDDETAAEFQRVVDELGVAPGANPKESILAVHNEASGWLRAIDAAEAAKTTAAGGGKGFFEMARRFARNAIGFKAGFAAAHAIGGPIGSAAGVAASALTRATVDRIDDALVGGTLVTSKTSVKSKISSVVAKYGGTTARGVRELGPVSSYLATSHFFGGRKDDATDVRVQARNRIDDVQAALMTAPDTAFAAVEGLLGHTSDIAYKTHAFIMNAVNHLASVVPKDPGLDIKMFSSKWTPAWHEAVAFSHRLEAVHNPMSALARLLSGAGHPAAAETLWTVWPAVMQYAAAEIVEKASRGEFSTQRASAFSRIFRVPLTGFQHPAVVTALQGQYLPPPELGAGGGASRAPQPTGRPPAVQSPVAGSNVASLIA